jgi:hypothetical protein
MTYKKMIVHFAGVDACEVELLDLPITQLICRLHIMNAKKCGYWTRKGSTVQHRAIITEQYDETFESAPERINKAIETIKDITGYDWPIRAYPGMDFNECNALHRMFTTGKTSMKGSVITATVRDRIFNYKATNLPAENWWSDHLSDEEFGLEPVYPSNLSAEQIDLLNEQFEMVNAEVHRYEEVCLVSQRSNLLYNTWGGDRLHEMFDVAWDERNHHGMLVNRATKAYPLQDPNQLAEFGYDKDIYSDLVDSYTTDPEIDVYGMKCIVGKSYMTAWHQYDDPRQWDITRTQTLSGAFTLDPHRITNQFYNSDYFLNWLDEYGHPRDPKLYGHVPVGRILNGWGPDQMISNPPYVVFKNIAECETEMQSEVCKICNDWTVTHVVFE